MGHWEEYSGYVTGNKRYVRVFMPVDLTVLDVEPDARAIFTNGKIIYPKRTSRW